MPTEELFGAYHFLLETDASVARDSFDFTATPREQKVGLLLPAVQRLSARDSDEGQEAPSVVVEWTDFRASDPGRATASESPADELLSVVDESNFSGHFEAYEVKWGTRLSTEGQANQPAAAVITEAGLRSDGELVQAVSGADMGGDFIL